MSDVNRSNHYRVFPKTGSEHRRRMATNRRAAQAHLRPAATIVGMESTSDTQTGQMVIEKSPGLLMSCEHGKPLGEVVD